MAKSSIAIQLEKEMVEKSFRDCMSNLLGLDLSQFGDKWKEVLSEIITYDKEKLNKFKVLYGPNKAGE